jgi:hypothetical protein
MQYDNLDATVHTGVIVSSIVFCICVFLAAKSVLATPMLMLPILYF